MDLYFFNPEGPSPNLDPVPSLQQVHGYGVQPCTREPTAS